VRRIDAGDLFAQAATVGGADRAGLADGAPVFRLVGHLADRRERAEPAVEDRGQRHRHQPLVRLLDGHGHGPGILDHEGFVHVRIVRGAAGEAMAESPNGQLSS